MIFRKAYLKIGTVILLFFVLIGCTENADLANNGDQTEDPSTDRATSLEQRLIVLEAQLEAVDHLEHKISELEVQIADLKQQNRDLDYELLLTNRAMTAFPKAWPAVKTFIEAYFERDTATLQAMLSEHHTVNENSISYVYEGEEIVLPIVERGEEAAYYLNNFASSPSGLFVQVMTVGKNAADEWATGFINLNMTSYGHEWVVEEISLDI